MPLVDLAGPSTSAAALQLPPLMHATRRRQNHNAKKQRTQEHEDKKFRLQMSLLERRNYREALKIAAEEKALGIVPSPLSAVNFQWANGQPNAEK